MVEFKVIKRVMDKLKKDKSPGEIIHNPAGGKHIRYSYHLNEKTVFSFGITRSSRIKSKKIPYVYKQMHITKKEFEQLDECTWNKIDLNKKLIDSGKI